MVVVVVVVVVLSYQFNGKNLMKPEIVDSTLSIIAVKRAQITTTTTIETMNENRSFIIDWGK